MKEVICINEVFIFKEIDGTPFKDPVNGPKKDDILKPEQMYKINGRLFYVFTEYNTPESDFYFDVENFADITGLQSEIESALKNKRFSHILDGYEYYIPNTTKNIINKLFK